MSYDIRKAITSLKQYSIPYFTYYLKKNINYLCKITFKKQKKKFNILKYWLFGYFIIFYIKPL